MLKKLLDIILLICIITFGQHTQGQEVYYSINGSKPITNQRYTEYLLDYKSQDTVTSYHLKTRTTTDSIIEYKLIIDITIAPHQRDPWKKLQHLVGERFSNYFDDEKLRTIITDTPQLNKPIFLNFYFEGCQPCNDEERYLQGLTQKFAKKVHFIRWNKNLLKQKNKKVPHFETVSNKNEWIEKLGITAFPTTFILDKFGIIRLIIPQITWNDQKIIEIALKVLE